MTQARGFTLIELLVSIIVLMLLVTIVFVSLSSVTRTAEVAREATEEARLQQFLWRHLTTHITAIYSDAGASEPSMALSGEEGQGAFGAADELRFIAALPMEGGNSLPGIYKRVTYSMAEPDTDETDAAAGALQEVREEDDGFVHRVLRITEDPFVLAEFSAIEEEQSEQSVTFEEFDIDADAGRVYEVPVASFDVSYYDGEEWVDDWDSMDQGRLPWAIRVQSNFMRTDEQMDADLQAGIDFQDEADLDLMLTLPLGAGVESLWVDLNHDRAAQAEAVPGELPPNQIPVDGNESPLEEDADAGSGRTFQ